MNVTRIHAVLLRQFFLMSGSVTRIIPLFVWVAIDVVLWGFITHYLNGVSGSSFNFVSTLLGAVVLWGFLTRVMQGVTMAFLEDVWSRNFLNIFASPLTIGEYVTGLVITSIITSCIGLVVMLLLADVAFGLSFSIYGLYLLPQLLTLFVFGIALGIASTALVLRYGPAAEWFVWPIPALISPFVGVFYPLSVLPSWMQTVGHFLPPSYVFESMRALVTGAPVTLGELACGFGLAVFYLAVCAFIFRLVFARALKTGLIARYSAENIS